MHRDRDPLLANGGWRWPSHLDRRNQRAEDLRGELDIVSEDALEVTDATVVEGVVAAGPEESAVEPLAVAARSYLQRRIAALAAPLDLATLAWELQRQLGQEIVAGWLGYGTFKALLIQSVPGVKISGAPPAFVIPEDYRFVDPLAGVSLASRGYDRIPTTIMFLKRIDRSFPLYDADDWRKLYLYLAMASGAFLPDAEFDIKRINELTRIARERSLQNGEPMPRSAFNYVAMGAWYRGLLRPNMSAEEFGQGFLESVLSRVSEATAVSEDAKQELRVWLGLGEDEPSD